MPDIISYSIIMSGIRFVQDRAFSCPLILDPWPLIFFISIRDQINGVFI